MLEEIITKNSQDFQHFSESELSELRKNSFIRSYKKGQVLFYPGDPRSHLILLVSGVIKIEKNDSSGDFSYLQFMKKSSLFPKIGLFQDEVHYDSAVAYTDIKVVFVPVKLFENLLQKNTQQLVQWVKEQSILLKDSITKIQKGTTNDTSERIVTSLAILLNDLGESTRIDNRKCMLISCPITISDIARMSGTTRETTSGVMKKLIKMNRIKYEHKLLIFLDTPFFIDRLSN